MPIGALILDFDGVIADSETLANTVLAEMITGLGFPTTLDDALDRYMGKRWPEVIAAIERELGRRLHDTFSDDLKSLTLDRFRRELREVAGASAFLDQFAKIPRCIASSSSLDRLRLCIEVLGLAEHFGDNVVSADMVAHGKPHPDIFLFAADRLRVPPSDCIVVEDSISGVRAGIGAGMTVIGFCGGSHLRPGHAERLSAAGAGYVAHTWGDVRSHLECLVAE